MSGGDVDYCVTNSLQLLLLFLARNVTNRSTRFTPPPVWSPTNGSNDGSVRASPSLADRSPVRALKTNSDEELIKFLNSSEPPVDRTSEEVSFIIFLLYFWPLYNIAVVCFWSSTSLFTILHSVIIVDAVVSLTNALFVSDWNCNPNIRLISLLLLSHVIQCLPY
jgi:hypothetical protein